MSTRTHTTYARGRPAGRRHDRAGKLTRLHGACHPAAVSVIPAATPIATVLTLAATVTVSAAVTAALATPRR